MKLNMAKSLIKRENFDSYMVTRRQYGIKSKLLSDIWKYQTTIFIIKLKITDQKCYKK